MSGISNIGSSGELHELAEYVDGLPNLSGAEALSAATIKDADRPVFAAPASEDPFAGIQTGFAIALHMHQPLIPRRSGTRLRTAAPVRNLQYMAEHSEIGDHHNAAVHVSLGPLESVPRRS